MLDLDHPQAEHIFAASALCDRITLLSQAMTLASSAARRMLLQECGPILEKLHRLNAERFEADVFTRQTLLELKKALQDLAGDLDQELPQSDGPVMEALEKLDSPRGFGTMFI